MLTFPRLLPPRSYQGLSGAAVVVCDAILFLGLVGIYYPGWGRVMAWLSCAAALARYYELNISSTLLRNLAVLLLPLIFTSLLAVSHAQSIRAVLDIALGLCMFLPGVLFGRRLLIRPFQAAPLVVTSIFVLIHFAFPQTYLGRISYGFFDNPNLNGRGLTYVALLIGILMWSFAMSSLVSGASRLMRLANGVLFFVAFVGVVSLLILTNYRAGWLAISFFSISSYMVICRASYLLRIAFSAALSGGLIGLIMLVDVKGFGYGSTGERLLMWICSLESWFRNYFWFGAGFDSFKSLSLSCLPTSAIGVHSYPHNILIELILSGGFVGFACVFIFVILQLKVLIRAGSFTSPVAIAAACSILSLLISAQLGMKFASFTFIGSISALVGIAYSRALWAVPPSLDQ